MTQNRRLSHRSARLALLPLALLVLACSDDATGPTDPPVTYDLYVDVHAGDDANAGGEDTPLKTITAALALAEAGDRIKVAPGTYDETAGEAFPLMPAGVELIGDEANKGAGNTPTLILGGVEEHTSSASTILPGSSTVVAGFSLRNPGPTHSQNYCVLIMTPAKNVTLRNCTIAGSAEHPSLGYDSAVMIAGADSLLITGNRIVNNPEVGLNFNWG